MSVDYWSACYPKELDKNAVFYPIVTLKRGHLRNYYKKTSISREIFELIYLKMSEDQVQK